MTELNVIALALVIKVITLVACVWGIVMLASEGKDGWGWLVLLAVIVASTTYKYTKD